MASSTRFRAASLVMRLARWNLTVLMLMWSSLPISVFVFPRATVRSTSSSRSVRASTGWTGPAARVLFEKVDRSRAVIPGSMSASPCTAAWMAWINWSGAAPLRRKPRAPALRAPWMYSSVSNVVIDHHDGDRIVDPWSGEQTSGFYAVEVRHPNVEQAHVGSQFASECDGFASVGGLADDFDVRLAIEDR